MNPTGNNSVGNIVETTMPKNLLINTIYVILRGFDKFEKLSDVAEYIKEKLQKFDSPNYHVIIGEDYICNVTIELNKYLFFKLGVYNIIVFKAGWFKIISNYVHPICEK